MRNLRALKSCPCCGGKVHDVVDHEQFVVDLPKIEAYVKRIVTQSGHCGRCSKRVRSTHPDCYGARLMMANATA